MDIVKLIRSNIRYKKGSFKGIMILMMIIALSVSVIVSLKRNFPNSIESAYDRKYDANITLNIRSEFLTDEMVEDLRNDPLVGEVSVVDALCPNKCTYSNGKKISFSIRLVALNETVDSVWNDDMTGLDTDVPELSRGEVYLPRALKDYDDLKIGDKMTAYFEGEAYEFTIKGFVEEPACGSSFMPLKVPFISREDFEEIAENRRKAIAEDPSLSADLYEIVYITKADDCKLTDNRFAQELNKSSDIESYASGILTRSDSLRYHGLMPDIILNIFLAFVIILAVIVFVVMSNSISSSIEMNYTDLGILKAQGFDNHRLKLVFLGQYMLAEIIGTVIGFILSIPVVIYLPRVFEPIVGIKIVGGVAIGESLLILLGMLIISALYIMLISQKVGTISPIRAISGGRCEVFFESRMTLPIKGRALSPSLAFRQFTSGGKRYVASILIASLLVFFLMTMTGMTDAVSSENALRAMGAISEDITVYLDTEEYSPENTEYVRRQFDSIENIIRQYTDIEERYGFESTYMVLNGEKLSCRMAEDEEVFTVTKGRAPLYYNEIVVSQIYAEDMGYNIGDVLEVSYRGRKKNCVISGYVTDATAAASDAGRFFGMNSDAATFFIDDFIVQGVGYKLSDPGVAEEIKDKIKSELPGDVIISVYSGDGSTEQMITMIAYSIKAVIYFISVIFALVVVSMICSKTFVREKIDIGIYKALGFTSRNLRLQFAVRFLIVAFFGIIIGTTLSLVLSEKLLSYMLRSMGIVNFVIDYRFITVFLPIVSVALCYFLFAYIAAGKTKKVEVRSLITE
ncbi:MAG: FtsX-like permease family protein [Eubacterium sp.]|nr:FtsX-like permease family protein [Eubacterium sp.]